MATIYPDLCVDDRLALQSMLRTLVQKCHDPKTRTRTTDPVPGIFQILKDLEVVVRLDDLFSLRKFGLTTEDFEHLAQLDPDEDFVIHWDSIIRG